MKITLQNISKKYNRETIFKDLTQTFEPGKSYAIIGSNGSGKSTLLQVISGFVRPSSGEVIYEEGKIDVESVYNEISIATPYLELIEEFTLTELIDFHFKFKNSKLTNTEIIKVAYLEDAKNKQIKNFSSGMKQRLKLALAIFSDSSLILLDEPTSNLDKTGTNWYIKHIQDLANKKDKTIIVASNQSYEYEFCNEQLNIESFKP